MKRTTLKIDENVLRRLKQRAAIEGTSLQGCSAAWEKAAQACNGRLSVLRVVTSACYHRADEHGSGF
jgi:hypothetical protein